MLHDLRENAAWFHFQPVWSRVIKSHASRCYHFLPTLTWPVEAIPPVFMTCNASILQLCCYGRALKCLRLPLLGKTVVTLQLLCMLLKCIPLIPMIPVCLCVCVSSLHVECSGFILVFFSVLLFLFNNKRESEINTLLSVSL